MQSYRFVAVKICGEHTTVNVLPNTDYAMET